METWRPVVGFEGRYEVSDAGRVRSLDARVRYVDRAGREGFRLHQGKVLSARISAGSRYVRVALAPSKTFRMVHTLVAEAFCGPRPDGYVAMHLDGNRRNNCADNIAWGSQSENLSQIFWDGRRKVTPAAVANIRAVRGHLSADSVCSQFGISASHVRDIWRGKYYASA